MRMELIENRMKNKMKGEYEDFFSQQVNHINPSKYGPR